MELKGSPHGPSTQYLRFLAPKTIPLMGFGTSDLKYWVLGPSGCGMSLKLSGREEAKESGRRIRTFCHHLRPFGAAAGPGEGPLRSFQGSKLLVAANGLRAIICIGLQTLCVCIYIYQHAYLLFDVYLFIDFCLFSHV